MDATEINRTSLDVFPVLLSWTKTSVNLGLFFRQLLITHGSYLFLVMAFHSILFLYASSLISKKYRGDTVKSKQDVLIYNSTLV